MRLRVPETGGVLRGLCRRISVRSVVEAGVSVLPLALAAGVLLHGGGKAVEASSRASLEAGATLFHEKGCEYCHGVNGVGTEKGPDLSMIGKKWKRPQIEQQILQGGNGMPAFGDILQPDETQSLVEYLSAKRKRHL